MSLCDQIAEGSNTRCGSSTPLHDSVAEESLLGACLVEGDNGHTFARAVAESVTTSTFFLPQNQTIWSTLSGMHAAGTPLALETLAAELRRNGKLQTIGGYGYILQVTNKAPTTAFVAVHLEVIKRLELLRRIRRTALETSETVANFTGTLADAEELAFRVAAQLAPKQRATDKAFLTELETRRLTAASRPAEPETRLSLAGKPIATPGNLELFIAKAKSGKTAGIGAAVASAVAAALGHKGCDTLHFSSPDPKGKTLLLIDTEQSKSDAHACMMRALARAETDVDPPWLAVYGLAGYSAADLRKALVCFLEDLASQKKQLFAVVLDGVADFVNDVNDPKECNPFVAELHAHAIRFDCPILCVIHSNEGRTAGDDGRGHLGKQLTRKAESNLLFKKVGDITTITSEKQRKAPITETDGVAFKWSEEEGRHVTCASPRVAKDDQKREKLRDMAEAAFEHSGKTSLRFADFVKSIQQMRRVSASTAEDRFTGMKRFGVITKCPATNLWSLAP